MCRHELILEADLRCELCILHQALSQPHKYGIEGDGTVEEGQNKQEKGKLGVGKGVGEGKVIEEGS
jgi:hypothetical protein